MRAYEILMESELLIEVEIPSTEYGYWISPEGEIFSIPDQAHYRFMMDHYNIDVLAALNNGWIRVITEGSTTAWTIEVEVRNGRVTSKGLATLSRLARSGNFDSFNVEVIDSFGRNYKKFNRSGHLVNFLQQAVGR
jgi:hypothetical protein